MNGQHSFNERRKHARFELLDYASISKGDEATSIRSVIVDISLGGLQVRSRDPFDVDQEYKLTIGRGDEEPIEVFANSVQCKKIEDTDLWSTGFKLTPKTAVERITWVEYVHGVFKAQGETLIP
ncbi:PilZ domain-containing protein [Kamptonema cortianum]|nr:PilZ domain-containing protein [Geitlerinema splendidum]MDK3156910.1 PilZ domain-containing protein [Kamptonema cortianum]